MRTRALQKLLDSTDEYLGSKKARTEWNRWVEETWAKDPPRVLNAVSQFFPRTTTQTFQRRIGERLEEMSIEQLKAIAEHGGEGKAKEPIEAECVDG